MRSSIVWLSEHDVPEAFPPVERALHEPNGLLAAGGDLSPERLLAAYRRGIFPWYSRGQPILWWSPDPRAVLFPEALYISRSLAKSIRNKGFTTRIDAAFSEVIHCCGSSELRPDGTWLSAPMRLAYQRLHAMGHAHSFETWRAGRLVGGLYGVAIGQVFFGESMFSLERDASKVALARLCAELQRRDVRLIDCQMATPHLLSLGAQLIPRAEFTALLVRFAHLTDSPEPWADREASSATAQPASRPTLE